MNKLFETKTMLCTVRVFDDHLELKEPMRSRSIPLSSIATIDTGFSASYDFIIETTGGDKYKTLVKTGDKQKLKDAIFSAKSLTPVH